MHWDIAALLLLLGLAVIGFRLGATLNLVATIGLGAAITAGILWNGSADLPIPALAVTILLWIACPVVIWIALRRRTHHMSVLGGGLGIAQGAVALVLLVGALGSAMPEPSMASARVYPPIAAIGDRLRDALPEARLAYPAPASPEPTAVPAARSIRPMDWAEAKPFVSAPVRHLTGTIRAADRAPLGFEVDGRVASVRVRIGDAFEAGDVLATLETTSLQIALDEAEAAQAEAQAVAQEAELDFARQQTLYDRGVVSKAAFDAARAAHDSATSRLAVARIRVADAEERLNDTILVAPYDG